MPLPRSSRTRVKFPPPPLSRPYAPFSPLDPPIVEPDERRVPFERTLQRPPPARPTTDLHGHSESSFSLARDGFARVASAAERDANVAHGVRFGLIVLHLRKSSDEDVSLAEHGMAAVAPGEDAGQEQHAATDVARSRCRRALADRCRM